MKTISERFQIVPSITANKPSTRGQVQAYGEVKSRLDLPDLDISQCFPKCGIPEGTSNNELINPRMICLCCKSGHKIKKSGGLLRTQRRKTSSERPMMYELEVSMVK
jgi:hypothetical protein